MYKQTILPVLKHADLIVECGPADKVNRLQGLQDRALRIIDSKEHPCLEVEGLSLHYKVIPLNQIETELNYPVLRP